MENEADRAVPVQGFVGRRCANCFRWIVKNKKRTKGFCPYYRENTNWQTTCQHFDSNAPRQLSQDKLGADVGQPEDDSLKWCHCHPDTQAESMDDPNECGNCGRLFIPNKVISKEGN
jgi:hypothetical protein